MSMLPALADTKATKDDLLVRTNACRQSRDMYTDLRRDRGSTNTTGEGECAW
jgi:hypothetical protein